MPKAINTLVPFKKEPRFKMSDTSRPQRTEVLESNVGDMKVKLSYTRAHIEQMTSIMRQLLHAKSADRGQQEEKSGGSGRGDANDESGGAGKAPRKEGAAGTRVGATTEIAARGKMSSHGSRASDGSRPANDTGRRQEVPAGVGPMINMQRGKARNHFSPVQSHTMVMEF